MKSIINRELDQLQRVRDIRSRLNVFAEKTVGPYPMEKQLDRDTANGSAAAARPPLLFELENQQGAVWNVLNEIESIVNHLENQFELNTPSPEYPVASTLR